MTKKTALTVLQTFLPSSISGSMPEKSILWCSVLNDENFLKNVQYEFFLNYQKIVYRNNTTVHLFAIELWCKELHKNIFTLNRALKRQIRNKPHLSIRHFKLISFDNLKHAFVKEIYLQNVSNRQQKTLQKCFLSTCLPEILIKFINYA